MSEIYLTKVERKTIFTQGLIYVLITFVISDLTVVGSPLFSMIPWIFFLGILGVNKFSRPIMTISIITITIFMAGIFRYGAVDGDTLISTIIALAISASGTIVGLCIREFVLEHRLVKQISLKKKMIYIVTICILTVSSVICYSLKYGNIVGFSIAKEKLANYMSNSLNCKTYTVDKYQYICGTFSSYAYRVKALNENIELTVADDVKIMNLTNIRENLSNRLNEEYDLNAGYNITYSYEFENSDILPSGITLIISAGDVDKNNEMEIKNLTYWVNRSVTVRGINNSRVNKCIININDGVSTILKEDFDKITEEYIKKCIEVEIID